MNIYLITNWDGYYKDILLHNEKYSSREIHEMLEQDDAQYRSVDEIAKWLVESKGFVKPNYTCYVCD